MSRTYMFEGSLIERAFDGTVQMISELQEGSPIADMVMKVIILAFVLGIVAVLITGGIWAVRYLLRWVNGEKSCRPTIRHISVEARRTFLMGFPMYILVLLLMVSFYSKGAGFLGIPIIALLHLPLLALIIVMVEVSLMFVRAIKEK